MQQASLTKPAPQPPSTATGSEAVFLKPQDPKIYNSTNGTLEPQYITSIDPTEAWIWISSRDCAGDDKTNCRYEIAQPLGTGVRRINLLGTTMLWDSPNVNPRNQRVRFFSTNSGGFHEVDVPTGFYATSVALAIALVAALNTATGSSGLTFSQIPTPLFPNQHTISAVGGDFYFDQQCNAVVKGMQLWSLPASTTATASKTTGTMFLMYTEYVDVVSIECTKNAKVRSLTSNQRSNVVVRAYLGGQQSPGTITFYEPDRSLSFAHRYQDPIYALDFRFLDQNGDQLYVSDPAKLQWQITLGFES